MCVRSVLPVCDLSADGDLCISYAGLLAGGPLESSILSAVWRGEGGSNQGIDSVSSTRSCAGHVYTCTISSADTQT